MKKFEKVSTQVALENAKVALESATRELETAGAAMVIANSRANRKKWHAAKINFEHAYARVGHLEVALATQSENHDTRLRKTQVGDIVVPMTDDKKKEVRFMKEARKPKQAESMADAMERYEKSLQWEKDKADKAEAKRIKREAKKAAAKEAQNARMAQKMAKRQAEIAKKREELAEKAEAEKDFAKGYTAKEAYELVIRLNSIKSLLDALKDEVNALWEQKQELRTQARKAKDELDAIGRDLKRPMCSSKYREVLAKKAELEARINEVSKQRAADIRMGEQLIAERKALKRQIEILKEFGNSAARPAIKAARSLLKKQARIKRAEIQELIRKLDTIAEKASSLSFQVNAIDQETFMKATGLGELIRQLNSYKANMKNGKEAEEARAASLAAKTAIEKRLANWKPVVVSELCARPSRLRWSVLALIFRIDTEEKSTRNEWMVLEHGLEEAIKPSWKLFSANKKEGQKMADDFSRHVLEVIGEKGVTMFGRDGQYRHYEGLFSSASHQKKEKLVMGRSDLMKLHEEAIWFGKTKAEILKTDLTGAEIWKMRANMARPIAFALQTKDGQNVYLHDGWMVKDVKKTYHHDNAVRIGGEYEGQPFKVGPADNEVAMWDGTIVLLEEMNTRSSQGGANGLKGMMTFKGNADVCAARKHGLDKLELKEGKKFIFGDGCFKFDKVGYKSFEEYAARMDELAVKYPGINQLYVLRQAEELEDDDKIRRLSRSLTQQLMTMADEDIVKIAAPTVNRLNFRKTFEGQFTMMAELNTPEAERSLLGQIFYECPGLIMNKNVQASIQKKWEAQKHEAMGNKFKVDGQYPYITQDLVAFFEVHVLGISPDDENLGVLAAGEVSLVGVPDGKKVLGIRYPANYLTARVLTTKALIDIFGDCGNVAILSIHDDILIVQDGDVDGDEMGIIYSERIVRLCEEMQKTYKPYVVVFDHGAKGERAVIGTEKELNKRMYNALWFAKRFDSVGLYANLARDCAYLACIEYNAYKAATAAKDETARRATWLNVKNYLLWMAAASTGAILAIDQVKGNAISDTLIGWLEKIQKDIKSKMVIPDPTDEEGKKMMPAQPWTQPYVKNDFSIATMPRNNRVITDKLGGYVEDVVGKFKLASCEFVDNNEMLKRVLLDSRYPVTVVRKAPVTSGVLMELRNNYFNTQKRKDGETSIDEKVFALIKQGKPVGQKDLLVLYYRNKCSLAFREQAKSVPEMQAKYLAMVRQSLMDQALSIEWVAGDGIAYPKGHVFTPEEKMAIVVSDAVIYALELNGKNNDLLPDQKGGFAKFVLEVFAKDILANIRRNNVDIRLFMQEDATVANEAGYEETDFDLLMVADEENDASVLDDGSFELRGDDDYDDFDDDAYYENLAASFENIA